MGLKVGDEFSFIFSYSYIQHPSGFRPSFYCLENVTIESHIKFYEDVDFDGVFDSNNKSFNVHKAYVGNAYALCRVDQSNSYFVVLDKQGTLSDEMDLEEITEHFEFVRAST